MIPHLSLHSGAQCEKGATRYSKIPEGIEIKTQLIKGMKSEWLIPVGGLTKTK